MDELLREHMVAHQIAIKIANGGYVVTVVLPEEGGWTATTSVFSDLASMLAFVARVAQQWEGPDAEEYENGLGPLNVPEAG